VKGFGNRSGVSEFRSFNNSTSKGVLDLLETIYFRLRKIGKPYYIQSGILLLHSSLAMIIIHMSRRLISSELKHTTQDGKAKLDE